MEEPQIIRFQEDGFVVLRGALDSDPLSAELDAAFADGVRPVDPVQVFTQGTGRVTLQYLPMMCEQTPLSLGLCDRFAIDASQCLGRAVLPGRPKGTRYYGNTGWHRDTERDLPSIAFVAYLEALDANTGALRVVPGSHADLSVPVPPSSGTASTEVGEAIETEPGDVIVFDERLIHASTGGVERRQWRVDFVVDPRDAREELLIQENYLQVFPDGPRAPGYNADRYPSYGPYWQSLERPWTSRLRELGVYRRAEVAEGR